MGFEKLNRLDVDRGLDDERRAQERRAQLRRVVEELTGVALSSAELAEARLPPGKRTVVEQLDEAHAVHADDQPAVQSARDPAASVPWPRRRDTLDDYRVAGLREVLARLPDGTLRSTTLAAADPAIARGVPGQPAQLTDAGGHAIWRAAERHAATLYRQAQDAGEVASEDPVVEEALARIGTGERLPTAVRVGMESELGISFDRVRIHIDAVAAAAARAVNARAFTVGEDIFFAEGCYAPDTRNGRKLLAHELWHVVQGYQGRTARAAGITVSQPGDALESEAHAIAERVHRGGEARPRPGADRSTATRQEPRVSAGSIAPPSARGAMLLRDTEGASPQPRTSGETGESGQGTSEGGQADGNGTEGTPEGRLASVRHTPVRPAPNEQPNRTTVGVGEVINFTADRPGTWQASADRWGERRGTGTSYQWTAPARPGRVTITYTPSGGRTSEGGGRGSGGRGGGGRETITFEVVAPRSVSFHSLRDFSRATSAPPWRTVPQPGKIRAGMQLQVKLLPLTVSFQGVFFKEGSCEATARSGFWSSGTGGHDIHAHPASARWFEVGAGNVLGERDTAALQDVIPTARDGFFQWVIPNWWSLEANGAGTQMASASYQRFYLTRDNSLRITKEADGGHAASVTGGYNGGEARERGGTRGGDGRRGSRGASDGRIGDGGRAVGEFERGDEAMVTPEGERPTHILRGSTHRFGALMHIYESGDFGTGGLGPSTVIGANGETLEQVYQMYRRGEIASENDHFRANHAAELVDSFRQHGFITDAAEAERRGLGGRDGVHAIRIVPVEEGQDPGPPINERLGGESGINAFVVNGYRAGDRASRRERLAREAFLETVQHDGQGNWTRDGRALEPAEQTELRTHLAESAERRGVLRGARAQQYREYLADSSNPPLDAESWHRTRSQSDSGSGSDSDVDSSAIPTGPQSLRDRRFHAAVDRGDYAEAVRIAGEHDEEGGADGGPGAPARTAPPAETAAQSAADSAADPAPTPVRRAPPPATTTQTAATTTTETPATTTRTPATTTQAPPTESEQPAATTRTAPQPVRRAPQPSAPEAQAPAPEPAPQPDAAPQADRRTRAEILREELVDRLRSGDEQTARRAHAGLRRLDDEGPTPRDEVVDDIAEDNRIDIYQLAPRDRRREGRVGHDGTITVDELREDGSERSTAVRVDQHGGSVEREWNRSGRPEDRRSVGVTYGEQRDADGNVVGRDVGLTGGRGRLSGEISGGYTFVVEPAAEQPDGSFQVTWTVSLRGALSGSGSGGQGGGGMGTRGNVTRSGTYVATGGTREENLAAAEAYREDFRNHAIREFDRAAGRELGTVRWWTTQPVGTSRRVAIGGSLSAQGSASIFRTLSIGVGGEISAADEAEVTRAGGNTVTVTQTWEVGGSGSARAGFLVNTSYGGETRHRVRETYAVDLVAGEAAFARFLDHEHPLEQGQAGVTLRSRRQEDSSGTTAGVSAVGVGELQGGEGTGEIREQRYDEQGNVVDETVTETGQQHHEGSTSWGEYSRRRFEVQAPETDEDYQIDTNLHGSEGDESAAMLGNATGEGRAGSRAESSGNWIVSEGVTQEEALRFHRNLINGEEPGLGSPLGDVYDDLRSVPTNDDELASRPDDAAAQRQLRANRRRRGAAISEFLSEEGDDGLRLLRSVAGGTRDDQYLRLFHRGEEDLTPVGERSAEDIAADEDHRRRIPTFMGRSRCREMEQWIAARTDGPVSPDDVVEARNRMADLDARIAQISNVDNYRDLPPAARAAEVARYRRYREQLAALVERAGDASAAEMSGDGQEHHRELRDLQRRVNVAHDEADTPRGAVISYRQRYGQAQSESSASERLPDNIASRTGAMWSSAESAYQGAEDARQAAEQRLATSVSQEDTRGEHDQRAAYRSAQGDLERALASYQTAREEMERLERVYQRYEAYRRGELEDQPAGDEQRAGDQREESRDRSPGGDDQAAGDEHAESGDRSPRRRRRRAEERQPSGRTAARSSETERSSESERDESERSGTRPPERLVIPAPLIAPHIQERSGGIADLARAVPCDPGPFTLPSGLGVRLHGARLVSLTMHEREQLTAQFGEGADIWNVSMEVATPAPDADAFIVRAMGPGSQIVMNRAGERFVGSVVKRASRRDDSASDSQQAIARSAITPDTPSTVPSPVVSALSGERGEPLANAASWSQRVGGDIGDARVVTGAAAASAAASIGARAFTVGNRVFFGDGNDPETDSGDLLAHELTHVVQQRGTAAPSNWESLPFVDHDDSRERAARAHDGAAAAPSEQAIARDPETEPRYVGYVFIPVEQPTQAGRELTATLVHAIPADRRHDEGLVMFKLLPAIANILDPDITAARSDVILSRSSAWHPASYEDDGLPQPYIWALWDYYKARWESDDRRERREHLGRARGHWRELMAWENTRRFVVAEHRATLRQLVSRLIDGPEQQLRRSRTYDVLSQDGVPLTEEQRAAREQARQAAAARPRRRGSAGRSETMDVAPDQITVSDGEAQTVRYVNPAALRYVPHRTSVSPDPRRAAFEPLAALLRQRLHATDPAARAAIDAQLPEAEEATRQRMRVYVRQHRRGAELTEALAAIDTLPMTVDVEVQSHDVDVGLFRVHLEPVEPGALIERPGGFRASTTEISTGRSVTGRASEEVMTTVLEGLSGEQLRIARQYLEVIRRAEGSLTSLNTWDRLRITLGSGVGAAGVLQNRFAEFQEADPEAYERIFGRHGIHVDSRVNARGRRHSEFRTTGDDGETLTGDAATEHMANDPAMLGVMVTAGFDPAWQAFLLRGGRSSIDRAFRVGFTVDGESITLAEGGANNLLAWLEGSTPADVLSRAMFSLADDFHGAGGLAQATREGFGPHYRTAAETHHFDTTQPTGAPGAARAEIATWIATECDHPRRRRHIDAVLEAPPEAAGQGTHPGPQAGGTVPGAAADGEAAIARSATAKEAPSGVPATVVRALSTEHGEPLPDAVGWSARVGGDVTHARVVTGPAAEAAAASIGARAFTVGNRVFFGGGYDPGTEGGSLLAHELTHVVQQRGAAAPSNWESLSFVNHDDARETAARTHDGAASATSEQAIARDPDPALRAEGQREAARERTVHDLTGRYEGGGRVTLQLNQAGRTVVGRYQVRSGSRVVVWNLTGELGWSNEGSTGFRATATRAGHRPRGPLAGLARPEVPLRLTLVFSGTDHLRVDVDQDEVHDLRRVDTSAIRSDSALEDAGSLDAASERTPLSPEQREQVTALVATLRRHLRNAFQGDDLMRVAQLGQCNRVVRETFERVPRAQHELFGQAVREELGATNARFEGQSWSLLDWLYVAVAGQHHEGAVPVDLGDIERYLQISGSARSAVDGQMEYRYVISFTRFGGDIHVVEGGGATVGAMRVRAYPAQRHGDTTAERGEMLWEQYYAIGNGSISAGLTGGGSLGFEDGGQEVTTPFPWAPQDFAGRITELQARAGFVGQVAGSGMNLAPSTSTVYVHGSGVFPPLQLEWESQNFGVEGFVGADVTQSEGYATGGWWLEDRERGDVVDPGAPQDRRVRAGADVHLGFETDQYTLSARGRQALREVLAWNRGVLLAPGTQIRVEGYASRRYTPARNRFLSEQRAYAVADAIRGVYPTLDPEMQHFGEEAAARAGVPDGDNAQAWRRADVLINGTRVLRLYAADAGDHESRSMAADDTASPPEAPPVQRKAAGDAPDLGGLQAAQVAKQGVQGAGSELPYRDPIQKSFGNHDISGVRAHVGGDAEGAAADLGAQAYAFGDSVAFKSTPDLHTAAHEAAHSVQQRSGLSLDGGIDGGPDDALEQQADEIADAVVAGESAESMLPSGAASAADSREPQIQRKKGKEDKGAPDIGAANYQWVSGTYKTHIKRSWFTSASDFKSDGDYFIAPSRVRELLLHLREKGMLSWVTPEVIGRASNELGVPKFTEEVFTCDLGVSVFNTIGLPPGVDSLVGRRSDGGLEMVITVPGVNESYGHTFKLSTAHKQQILTAMERFTGLPVKDDIKQRYLAADSRNEMGAGVVHTFLERSACDTWFGAQAYQAWLDRKANQTDDEKGLTLGAGVESQVTDLSTEEIEWVQKWLKANAKATTSGRPVVMSRLLYETLQKIEKHPERSRILAMMSGKGASGQIEANTLERLIVVAEFEAERERMGLPPKERTDQKPERPPTFDFPIPARIDQHAGLVIAGEEVPFGIEVDWPPAYTADQASDYTWRPHKAEVDWVFERPNPKNGDLLRDNQRSAGAKPTTKYRFQLDKDEGEAIWIVHAFVRHNYFQPKHLTTQVEVKTEQKRLEELRTESFTGLGQPRIANEKHNFDTSWYNETFGDEKYDKGILFRGDLPAEFQRRTPEQRIESLDREIERSEELLRYLRKDNTHPAAIQAAERYLAKLRDARETMHGDEKAGWVPFEIRGFFLGRGNRTMDGALDLYGAVSFTTIQNISLVTVQIRDLSRRMTADNYRFEGIADTFQLAFERAFVDLCKKYPAGRVSALAEELDPTGKTVTGKTVGFELDTGTEWEDTKEVVFDPVVNAVVNIGSAIVMIFVPATIPVLLPLTIAYNTTQTVDQMVDEWTSGTLTKGDTALYLSQIGLDLLPIIGRAKVFRASKMAFATLEMADWGGNMLVMTLEAQKQIAAIRDKDVADMAGIFAQLVELEKNTHPSDPTLKKLRADVEAQAAVIRGRSAEVWGNLVKQQAIAFLPIKAATHLERHFAGAKIKHLTDERVLVEQPDVVPHYDRKRGQIVGDSTHLDLDTINKLTAEQDAHMREVTETLAAKLGVEADRIVIKPDDQLAIWDDGTVIQVRYKPGTDPADAIAAWKKLAKRAKIRPEKGNKRGRSHADRDAKQGARDRTQNRDRNQPQKLPDPEPAPHVHDPLDSTPDELEISGDADAHMTTARAVPGSEFRGRAGVADGEKVKEAGHNAMQTVKAHVKEVKAIERVSSDHLKAGSDAQKQAADTYLVTLESGAPITIRLASGPLEGDIVARTIVNPTKTGSSRVERKAADGTVTKEDVAVDGRYVIQISSAVDPAHLERALAHEVTEILVERAVSKAGRVVGRDVLAPGEIAANAELSPHDRGRITELNVLAKQALSGDGVAQRRELLALFEHLGLREGTPGADARRRLIDVHLTVDGRTALTILGKAEGALDADVSADLMSVRTAAKKHETDAAERAQYKRPLHERPNPVGSGQRISPETAAQMAAQAAMKRANKSAETLNALVAEARILEKEGKYPRVKEPQIGGGAGLAARNPHQLFVDDRGRWQADPSERIAQTASQLRGLVDAGIGDPFQFAGPNERVPLAAVRYWEDTIATQGPVVNGRAKLRVHDDGRLLMDIYQGDKKVVTVEVEGTPAISSGFPPERIPGTPRDMTPDKAIADIKDALSAITADPKAPKAMKTRAKKTLAALEPLSATREGKLAREEDLAKARAILKKHGLDTEMSNRNEKAHQMLVAGEAWHRMRQENPDRVLLGDEANLTSLNSAATNDWVIAGTGGTGVSAAEIILNGNKQARVSMIGRDAPAGLLENDQFQALLRAHADPQTVASIAKAGGPAIDASKSDGRLSVVFGANLGSPKERNGTYRAAKGTPEGYNARNNNPYVGGGYIAAMGREGQLPPLVAEMVADAEKRGLRTIVEPQFDRDAQYIGYRVSLTKNDDVVRSVDVTGAASRFVPWHLVPETVRPEMQEKFRAASDLDAPPEGGNFDGGFVASATQAARYGRNRRATTKGVSP